MANPTKSTNIEEAKTVEVFNNLLSCNKTSLSVVHFSAKWAPQCQQMNEVLRELCKDASVNAQFLEVEAENLPDISQKYDIAAVPTFVFIQNNSVVDRLNGANAPELTKKIRHWAAQPGGVVQDRKIETGTTKEDLNGRLKRLINSAACMLFMKGNPQAPQCGFSKQVIAMLSAHNAQYSTFDILSDNEVREGLKKYSDWPTYPQLYINGELIGGLDILKEMEENGELDEILPKAANLDERLKSLTSKFPLMVFMKGNRTEPRCGFSKTLIGMLNDINGLEYQTFDILSDEEVRQGLKKFSNWPTYPQVYVKGELIGGLDIIKEMQESGELESALKGES